MLVSASSDSIWLAKVSEALRYVGYAIVTDVLDGDRVERVREAMYAVQQKILADVGQERLDRAGELGVLRLMMRYDERFIELLAVPEMLAVVDATLANTAVLHLQNGFILPPVARERVEQAFQRAFHRDFPRHLNGYVASINAMFAIDELTTGNGGTIVVPGTHQRAERPDDTFLEAEAISVECPPGSMVVFDSTLWHAAGANASDRDRLAINHQFTRSFFKQQVDYVRALGSETVERQPPRVQQLLGWYTRVVTSLDEYYRPPEERLYRSGQG